MGKKRTSKKCSRQTYRFNIKFKYSRKVSPLTMYRFVLSLSVRLPATVDIMKQKYFPNQALLTKKEEKIHHKIDSTRVSTANFSNSLLNGKCCVLNHPSRPSDSINIHPQIICRFSIFSSRTFPASARRLFHWQVFLLIFVVCWSLDAFNSASHCAFFTTVYLRNSIG